MKEWMPTAIATFILWGLWAFLPKLATEHIDPRSALVYQSIGGLIVGLGTLIAMRFKISFHPLGMTFALISGLFGFLGVLAFMVTLAKGPVSLVVPLSALYPVLSVVLALVFLRESMTVRQGLGFLLSLVAVVLISV